PNMLIVSVIGWKVYGFLGALVATLAICAPSSVLTFAIAHVWDRFRDAPLRAAIQRGLAPVTVGLVLASGYVLARTADETLPAYAITAATAALGQAHRYRTRRGIVPGHPSDDRGEAALARRRGQASAAHQPRIV